MNYDYVFSSEGMAKLAGSEHIVALLLLCGAVGKSAQLPLHVWLPDAMEGPSPVSALIHAATMVTAGVYMIARCGAIFVQSETVMLVVATIGGVTALFAATIAQRNIKGGKQAEASWWFVGRNKDGLDYNYVLQMVGMFPKDTVWPGVVTLPMTYWEMNDASGNGSTTPRACIDSGNFNTTIVVN